jgi:hypothetical protein
MKTSLFIISASLALTACGASQTRNAAYVTRAAAATNRAVKLTGTLADFYAIGGESTGFGIKTTRGSVEIDLTTHAFTSLFKVGIKAKLTGRFVSVSGIEIPHRRVFVVESIKLD